MPLTRTQACLVSAAAILLATDPAFAEEVRLICEGVVTRTRSVPSGTSVNENTGAKQTEYASVPYSDDAVREIRFDEGNGEFWYKGESGLSKDGAVDGWIPAKEVQFTESEITARFGTGGSRKAKEILSFGLARLIDGAPVGTLDRYTGIWRIDDDVLTCRKMAIEERKF